MHGSLDDCDRRPALTQAGLAPGALVGAAIVDDPEDPVGARVGLLAHHLLDETLEGRDPGGRLATIEHHRPVDIPGREVGERALPRESGRDISVEQIRLGPGETATRRRNATHQVKGIEARPAIEES
jgi:hypothetical protein